MIKWDTLKTAADKLDEYKASKKQWLDSERDRLTREPLEYGGKLYQVRDRDIINLMGKALDCSLIVSMGGEYQPVRWLTIENEEVTLTFEQLVGLGHSFTERKEHLVYKCREHKSAILELDSKQAVDDYLAGIEW